jgi:hypothetical protein
MASILSGVRDILSKHLADKTMNSEVLNGAIGKIENNWHGKQTSSKENWKLRFVALPTDKSKQKKGHDQKAEVPLERTIARAFDGKEARTIDGKKILWNQMPVASGLVESSSNDKANRKGKRRAVDLIYQRDVEIKGYEFLELKVANNKIDTPIDAAIEVLEYGLLYLFSRIHAETLGYSEDILKASRIGLRVLAERDYYKQWKDDVYFSLDELNDALKVYLESNDKVFGELQMDFRFEAFPTNFKCPEINDTNLNENLMESLRNAFLMKETYSRNLIL